MSKVIELRDRTKSITQIHSAANAMQVAAIARLKGIQANQRAAWHFKKHYGRLAKRLKLDQFLPPQKNARPVIRIYLLTSRRGFCGGFNEQLLGLTSEFLAGQKEVGKETHLVVLGKKGCELGKKIKPADKLNLVADFDLASFEEMTKDVAAAYRLWRQGEIEKIVVVFNEFVSMLVQRPRALELLPFDLRAVADASGDVMVDLPLELIIEYVAANYVRSLFYDACLQTFLGEVGSRLMTMRSATENSKEMLKSLKIKLNKARQAMITIELSEIISAFETLEEEFS